MAFDDYSELGMTEREYFYAEVLPFRICVGFVACMVLIMVLGL